MKKTILLAAALAALPLGAASAADLQPEQPGQMGVGVYVGIPFGLSAKYNFDRTFAMDFAFGAQGDNIDVHSDFLVHLRDLWPNPPQGKLPLYLGMGFKVADQSQTLFGIRFVAGLAYLVENHPLEIFAEVAPVLRLSPSTGTNFDGGVGLRYYFGLRK